MLKKIREVVKYGTDANGKLDLEAGFAKLNVIESTSSAELFSNGILDEKKLEAVVEKALVSVE